jgi:glycosyltransferase involved in cell wall biosynthesis
MVNRDAPLPQLTFVIHDLEGGVATMNYQIVMNADLGRFFKMHFILWRAEEDTGKPFGDDFGAAGDVTRFRYSKYDNYHLTLRRLHRLIESRPGVVVTNDGMELESVRLFGTRSILLSIVHDFYNLKLAVENLDLVDYFLCHTEVFTKALQSCFALEGRVKFLLHGVKVMAPVERAPGESAAGARPLRLVSISRLTATKGVMMLFDIGQLLLARGIRVEWVIIGSGELEPELRRQWEGKDTVAFHHPDKQEEVYKLAAACDIFISPSNFEGYGIALLEAMSCGLVPVISRLPVGAYSDLPAVVGISVQPGNAGAFADAIESLYRDRARLGPMRTEAAKLISEKYDISKTARNYLDHIRECTAAGARTGKRPNSGKQPRLGLLDKAYIPNGLSRMIKKLRRS